MMHRDMRRAKREVTELAELRAVVDAAQTVRVASHDAEGLFIVPMSFGYEVAEGEGGGEPCWTFWLHCASEGRKVDAWSADPQVALELDVEGGVISGDFSCAYSYAFASIMASGRAVRVTEAEEKACGLTAIMAHMAPGAPVKFQPEAVERVDVWRVDVDRLTGKRREGMRLG